MFLKKLTNEEEVEKDGLSRGVPLDNPDSN